MAGSELSAVAGSGFPIDEDYEFSAPRFFDFLIDEPEEEIRKAELWFDNGKSDAPSPFMMRIKASRFADTGGVLCYFENAKDNMVESECQEYSTRERIDPGLQSQEIRHVGTDGGMALPEMENDGNRSSEMVSVKEPNKVRLLLLDDKFSSVTRQNADDDELVGSSSNEASSVSSKPGNTTAASCTPGLLLRSSLKGATTNSSGVNSKLKKELPTKAAALSLKPETTSLKSGKGLTELQGTSSAQQMTAASEVAQDNQAIKRQKLDNGRIRKIHNVRSRVLPHKSKPDLMKNTDSFAASASSYLHEDVGPYVSVAEIIKKFESKTRELDLKSLHSHEHTASAIQNRQRLVLTRPKEPELQTAHRVRAVRIKSSAELEAEMLAKIPKFKARPVNKKILEAPSLPPLPKRIPQASEFREFNLKTMERFEKVRGTPSVFSSSTDSACQDQGRILKLTEARPPLLETALRARPSRIKTSEGQELEELENAPKFKAIPLNKKIFESKGDIGLPCKPKGQLTIPQEFHFATTGRFGPPQSLVVDLFDKLSIHSSEHNEQKTPRITIPNPFNLQTEERGMEKEKRLTEQLIQKQIEEEKARIPKANPYPYTTDYPVIPPKPQPKECTRPEGFQLESLIRHEEEQQRNMEMIKRMEKEEAQWRIFRARPIMKEDPLPIPEKERKPLTQVQEVLLHVDYRAEDRAEFDKKMKEKELMHKRLREENEHAKRIEEEKALKQMRRMMGPHARPPPNFSNPFLPQKSTKERTKPKSPKLRVAQRDERRRHYIR